MDISGVSIPAVPEVQQEPPRDAQLQTAVRETAQGGAAENNPQADSSSTDSTEGRRDDSSNVGQNIDERA